MTPIWTALLYDGTQSVMRICTQCKNAAEYIRKRAGQFYKCRFCGHRFQEKKR